MLLSPYIFLYSSVKYDMNAQHVCQVVSLCGLWQKWIFLNSFYFLSLALYIDVFSSYF